MYGYMDESGSQGVANYPGDYLVVSLVLFEHKDTADKCSAAIDRLRERLNLTADYEFHRSSNSTLVKQGFMKLLHDLDFKFISIAIRKNNFKKQATYDRLAELLVKELMVRNLTEIKIEMDSNPLLYSEMRKRLKANKLRYIRVREAKSHSNNLIQLVDYVVNISSKKAKNTPKSPEFYRPIANKSIVFIDITE